MDAGGGCSTSRSQFLLISCSVISSYCHHLTLPLLSNKRFGLVWGINWYYHIVQASCRDQFEYSFSCCLFPAVQWWERRSSCCASRHVCHPCRWLFFFKTICCDVQVMSCYSRCKNTLLAASLYSVAALYRVVLEVPGQIIAVFCGSKCFWLCSCCCLLLCYH